MFPGRPAAVGTETEQAHSKYILFSLTIRNTLIILSQYDASFQKYSFLTNNSHFRFQKI